MPLGVAGGSPASWPSKFNKREQWLNSQFASLKAQEAELARRTAKLQDIHDDRRRQLKEAVVTHTQMLAAADKRLKQREEAAETSIMQKEKASEQWIKRQEEDADKRIEQREHAAIQSLNEADNILAGARCPDAEQATRYSESSSNVPPFKKPRGSAGLHAPTKIRIH